MQDATDRGWFRTEPSLAKGKPDMSIILPTALEMAQALAYLHSQGVLHGDLSPGNVLLSDKPDAPHGFITKVSTPLHSDDLALWDWHNILPCPLIDGGCHYSLLSAPTIV